MCQYDNKIWYRNFQNWQYGFLTKIERHNFESQKIKNKNRNRI